ncbi:hypothetical protein [Kingella potus]|uniref:hypothetical protein n=1 Tax=Kingella potus TaxID=265175 RepID=UPI001FD42BE5|nr:hypothetical protein [Kingella potus]UOP00813.1 hypothetical protein LVJ84_13885 [Kingella potus]
MWQPRTRPQTSAKGRLKTNKVSFNRAKTNIRRLCRVSPKRRTRLTPCGHRGRLNPQTACVAAPYTLHRLSARNHAKGRLKPVLQIFRRPLYVLLSAKQAVPPTAYLVKAHTLPERQRPPEKHLRFADGRQERVRRRGGTP